MARVKQHEIHIRIYKPISWTLIYRGPKSRNRFLGLKNACVHMSHHSIKESYYYFECVEDLLPTLLNSQAQNSFSSSLRALYVHVFPRLHAMRRVTAYSVYPVERGLQNCTGETTLSQEHQAIKRHQLQNSEGLVRQQSQCQLDCILIWRHN